MIDLDKVRQGAACCIESWRTGECPPDCPYEDVLLQDDTIINCATALLMDLKTLIPG